MLGLVHVKVHALEQSGGLELLVHRGININAACMGRVLIPKRALSDIIPALLLTKGCCVVRGGGKDTLAGVHVVRGSQHKHALAVGGVWGWVGKLPPLRTLR